MTTNLPATRPANPLARVGGGPPVDPLLQLEAHVARLNNYRWAITSGKLFYIGSRQLADGTIQRMVERHA